MKPAKLLVVSVVACFLGLMMACSSSDSSGSGGGGSCAQAKKASDDCNAKQSDGGGKVTVNFDQSKCESAGADGEKVASCMVQNKSNCDCMLKCALNKGTC